MTQKSTFFYLTAFLVFIISISALYPFIKTGSEIDYDAESNKGAIEQTLMPMDALVTVHTYQMSFYRAERHPGTPMFTLLSGFFVFLIQKIKPSLNLQQALHMVQYINLCFFLLTLLLFARKIQKDSKNFFVLFLVLLCFALHPLSIWLAFAYVEEIYALFFSMLAWTLAEHPKYRHFALVFLAIAVNCKMTVLSMAPLIWIEAQDKESFSSSKKLVNGLIYAAIFSGLVSFLFYLPALASFAMDMRDALWQPDYGIKSFYEGAQVGWWFARITIQWWVIIFLFFTGNLLLNMRSGWRQLKKFIMEAAKRKMNIKNQWRLYKENAPAWLKDNNIIIAVFLLLCASTAIVLQLLGLSVVALWLHNSFENTKNDPSARRELWINIGLALACFLNIVIMMMAPTSRSFLYFCLLPGLALLLKKYRSVSFWVLIFLITFLPMFRYFHVTSRQIVIAEDGYYNALIHGHVPDFNDTGFLIKPTTKNINFPWNR